MHYSHHNFFCVVVSDYCVLLKYNNTILFQKVVSRTLTKTTVLIARIISQEDTQYLAYIT